jgi:hypothetical protein
MLRLADAWVWDFRLADDGRSYHLYFLQAPRRIGHPDARHHNVSIGHAVSPDLTAWTVVCDAITPSDSPAFDGQTASTRDNVHARPGGGPFNAARASARPGQQTRFPGRFSAGPLSAPDRQSRTGAEAIPPCPADNPAA